MERLEVKKYRINRRNLLKFSSASGLAILTSALIGKHLSSEVTQKELTVSSKLAGIIPNCPFLPYELPEVQERMINNMKIWEASCARIFLDHKFENKLGEYKGYLLDQIAATSRVIPLTVDLFDAYHALHSANPTSPYLIQKEGRDIYEKQFAIFTDIELKQALISRARVVVTRLKNEPGILAWGLANELNLRKPQHILLANAKSRTLRDVHTDLFEEMIENILSIDNKRPILIGIDDPNLIDENRLYRFRNKVINTIHVYPGILHENIITEYLKEKDQHILPLVCQEVGYSRAMRNFGNSSPQDSEYDEMTSVFFEQIFSRLYPFIIAFGPWRVSAQGDSHNDGFEIESLKHPRSISVIREIRSEILSNFAASTAG